MAKSEEEEVELTEVQRIAALEDSVSLNRKIVFVLAILAIVGLSTASTLGIVSLLQPDVEYVDKRALTQLQEEVDLLRKQATESAESFSQAKQILDSSSATAFKSVLLDQEQSYQLHLTALKQGMRDLARMLPGSRTWLDMYDEQMNAAIAQSVARSKQLAALQTNALLIPQAIPGQAATASKP
ncbi:hypothetical protein [Thalassolituus sp.]|jgi:hypothetical protein|uniref:hypothetical protein n=1 Tax=Thalassolituus sp. TaxID=2030822 RepID=UPI002A827A17|nr:hypothetical protein [Thalassolituus sp.]